ncbi:MAG: hypothetical protein U9R29_05030, partial [Thermodesulfobacteriota bacterium]|nr:hypothetical protein [Thermodesulfobacteriota bacterium]
SLIDDIGTELPKRKYLILKSVASATPLPLFGGLEMKFIESLDGKKHADSVDILNLQQRGSFSYHAVAGHLPKITKDDIEYHWNQLDILRKDGDRHFYKDDEIKIDNPKTFQLLAESACGIGKLDQKKHGKSLLGAFKADVDNLGFIFSIGLGKRISISRFASMSRMINHFFANHLVQRIKDKYPDIYLVFAGGDDLFLLGPWTKVIEFAEQIGSEFQRYVAGNKDVTLSAGISVVKPLLPMHTIADAAEELLEESKQYKNNGGEKNAITLFDVTTDWNKFSALLEQGDEYFDLLEEQKVTTGLIGRLLEYGKMYDKFKNKGDIRKGIYLSHMEYDFHRNLTFKESAERDNFTAVKHDDNLKYIAQPVTYALYRWRSDH